MIIIPIGLQCTNATFKKNINKTSNTFPFDWMFATPKFVFEMLTLLLKESMNIDQLVREHFFLCEKRANYHNAEHYYTCENGFALYNCKYDAIFPHDENSIDSVNKYIRRFKRLKDLILTTEEKIYFIYTSQSSLENGNFTIDGNNIINNEYLYLSKIYELIGEYRKNYKVIVFDSIKKEEKILNENIILCELNKCDNWSELLPQMNNYINLFEN